MNSKPLFRFSLATLVLGAMLILAGCAPKAGPPSPPPPAVTVAPVEQREIVEWEEFTGRTEAVESVEVRPRVSGHVQEVRFQSGQLVKQGDVLFVIDPRWHQAEFDRTQAEYDRAKVHLDNAEREARRTAGLLQNRAISAEEADAREARFREAQAAALTAAAAHTTAQLDLDFTTVRAPIAGRVSRALVTAGNYVSGVAGANTVLTTIVSVDPVYVYADMDENALLRFNALAAAQAGSPGHETRVAVDLALADEEGFPHAGFIESFDNHLDAGTGSILLRTVFPNADGRIVPGLFARIRVPLSERHQALLVDEGAIGTDQGQKYVFTLTPTNTVAYRAVRLGPLADGKRIVREGLASGEKIVVNGLQRVRPGAPVKAETAVAEVLAPKEIKTAQR